MKKLLLSAAAFAMVGVSALAVAPNTAQAIPAFARQTGMACYSCHFQSFPALTDYGRSFKRDAFTDVGSEALVEDDNLSIPAVLNATLVIHANYTNVNNNAGAGSATTGPGFSNGTWNLPLEAPLLIAGRMGKNMGAFGEFAGGAGAANGQTTNNWQVMSSFDMGNFRMGLNVFNTSFGWTAGIETFNVFGQHAGVLNGNDVSAVSTVGNGNDANIVLGVQTQGATLWAGNDLWFIGLTGWTPDVTGLGTAAGAQNVGGQLIPGIYGAITPNLAGWDTMLGFGWTNGTAGSTNNTGAAAGTPVVGIGQKVAGADLWWIDAQAQGSVGNTTIGVYADYAHTKQKANVAYNVFGSNPVSGAVAAGGAGTTAGDKTSGWSLRATVKPIPQWVFEAGYGETKASLVAADPLNVAGVNKTNKIWQIGGQYELYQNVNLKLMYEDQKVGAGYGLYTAPNAGGTQNIKTTTFELDALM